MARLTAFPPLIHAAIPVFRPAPMSEAKNLTQCPWCAAVFRPRGGMKRTSPLPGFSAKLSEKSGEIFTSSGRTQRRFAEHTEGNLSQQPRNYGENPINSESRIH